MFLLRNTEIIHIMITCPCNVVPLTGHFHKVKIGVYRGKHYFLIFALKHRLWVLINIRLFEAVQMCTYNLYSQNCSSKNYRFHSCEKLLLNYHINIHLICYDLLPFKELPHGLLFIFVRICLTNILEFMLPACI